MSGLVILIRRHASHNEKARSIDGKIGSLWVIIAPSSNFHARLVESYVAPKRKTRLVDKA
ncbi:hypothetical protein X749_07500 [Mesorhizobium sp. LNJC391B00]|nr:hypothetical protein X749_07500 [Mesorhizobium sp. LNJC391B00]